MTSLDLSTYTDAELEQMFDEYSIEEDLRTRSFEEFVRKHNPTALDYEHIPRLVDVADRVVRGELTHVMIIEPPRYLKSEVFSRLLPGYFLRRHPRRRVGLVCYGADLAWELSEEARSYYLEDGGTLAPATKAKRHWNSGYGGGMWAQGVGGALLGRGFHLGIIDDPTDPEKASSPTYQKRFELWYPAKWLSRQDPHSAMIGVMQRLGVGDPIDFLFRREVGENTPAAPQYWHVVLCDEIKSNEPLGRWSGPMGLPPTCTLEPDDRKIGEVLAPSLYDKEEVDRRQREAGPFTAAAQRQGRPMRPSGDFWKEKWFCNTYDELPPGAYDGGKDWDTAYGEDEELAASAYVESYRGPARSPDDKEWPIYIEKVDWDWREFPGLVEWMKSLNGPHYVEQKATGKSAVQSLQVYGINAEEVPVQGNKLERASAAQPTVSNHRIFVNKQVRDNLLYGERQGLLRITAEDLQSGGIGLDLNDAFVQALHRHLGLGRKKKRKTVQWA